jgi:hypothetical protein
MYRTLLLILLLTALGSFREAAAQNKASFDGFKLVDKTGNIHSTSENAQPRMPAKILAFMMAPPGRPVVEGK